MKKPNALIFSGYGLNTEDETKAALELVGARAEIIHINDLIAHAALLKNFQIAIMPGGFSFGDDTGSGKAYGNRLHEHLGNALEKFLARDTLMMGICNGFQILTNAGLLPGALLANDTPRYLTRWVDLEVMGESPWLTDIKTMSVPIAHGEGKYYAVPKTLAALKKENAIAFTYAEGPITKHFDLPANPNGSLENIAGVTAYKGRLLGMMPHPERAIRFTQLPHWTYLKEKYLRDGVPVPQEGPGLQLFRNAVRYFA
jgi:phosphoribosylformylglycinamidine synthase subunit PurQ / glutaminase